MILCYLAHPISDYGTERQRRAIALIEKIGWEVLNPDSPSHEQNYKLKGMDYFVGLVQRCQDLAFLRFPDDTIGAGVGRELEAAFEINIPVFSIAKSSTLIPVYRMPRNILSVDQTRIRIKQYKK